LLLLLPLFLLLLRFLRVSALASLHALINSFKEHTSNGNQRLTDATIINTKISK
jgi:hypothetical protein